MTDDCFSPPSLQHEFSLQPFHRGCFPLSPSDGSQRSLILYYDIHPSNFNSFDGLYAQKTGPEMLSGLERPRPSFPQANGNRRILCRSSYPATWHPPCVPAERMGGTYYLQSLGTMFVGWLDTYQGRCWIQSCVSSQSKFTRKGQTHKSAEQKRGESVCGF